MEIPPRRNCPFFSLSSTCAPLLSLQTSFFRQSSTLKVMLIYRYRFSKTLQRLQRMADTGRGLWRSSTMSVTSFRSLFRSLSRKSSENYSWESFLSGLGIPKEQQRLKEGTEYFCLLHILCNQIPGLVSVPTFSLLFFSSPILFRSLYHHIWCPQLVLFPFGFSFPNFFHGCLNRVSVFLPHYQSLFPPSPFFLFVLQFGQKQLVSWHCFMASHSLQENPPDLGGGDPWILVGFLVSLLPPGLYPQVTLLEISFKRTSSALLKCKAINLLFSPFPVPLGLISWLNHLSLHTKREKHKARAECSVQVQLKEPWWWQPLLSNPSFRKEKQN